MPKPTGAALTEDEIAEPQFLVLRIELLHHRLHEGNVIVGLDEMGHVLEILSEYHVLLRLGIFLHLLYELLRGTNELGADFLFRIQVLVHTERFGRVKCPDIVDPEGFC